jgi:hypothetical protein
LPWNIVLSIIGCFLISFLLFIVFSIFVTLFLMNFLYSAFCVSVAGACALLKNVVSAFASARYLVIHLLIQPLL